MVAGLDSGPNLVHCWGKFDARLDSFLDCTGIRDFDNIFAVRGPSVAED